MWLLLYFHSYQYYDKVDIIHIYFYIIVIEYKLLHIGWKKIQLI